MTRKYYSSRTQKREITIEELYERVQHLFLFFKEKDYFQQKLKISSYDLPQISLYEAALSLGFQPFPINEWFKENITENNLFDTLEFLSDHVSKPGERIEIFDENGWNSWDYRDFDENLGQEEFREKANQFLTDYREGYYLSEEGMILAEGTFGLEYILDAAITPYDKENVDKKVLVAIRKWRNRQISLSERKDAIREMADVFEWLRKTKKLDKVLDSKDEAAIFDIANNFSIRHHNPQQKSNYDQNIWYSWIFHFYLATYHAVIRLLIKHGI